jgi:hypothetical protein
MHLRNEDSLFYLFRVFREWINSNKISSMCVYVQWYMEMNNKYHTNQPLQHITKDSMCVHPHSFFYHCVQDTIQCEALEKLTRVSFWNNVEAGVRTNIFRVVNMWRSCPISTPKKIIHMKNYSNVCALLLLVAQVEKSHKRACFV